jgi:amino acid adenylation domain-containing protein
VARPAPADTAAESALDHGYVAAASFGQQRLWMLDRLLADRSVYNEASVHRLTGPLDGAALRRALGEIVARHDVLRTHFEVVDGALCQVVTPASPSWTLPREDLAGLPSIEREARARARAGADIRQPFDLGRGPLLRARLLRLAPDEHWLVLVTHHIASDRWSAAVLMHELSTLYAAFARGEPSPLPELPVQFADYAEWQRELLAGEPLERLCGYWTKALANLPTLNLPANRLRQPVASVRGAHHALTVDDALARALRDLALRLGATLFMLMLAAFFVLLHRWTGDDDIALGVPVAGRSRPELEPMIGFFVNMLVLRGELAGAQTFTAFLARVRRTALDAYAHAELPFEKLVERLAPARDLSRNPLYQVSFRLGNTPPIALELPDITVARVTGAVPETSKFDLCVAVNERGGALDVRFEYALDLFAPATIERLAQQYCALLGAIVADPVGTIDSLSVHDAAERERVLAMSSPPRVPFPERTCVHRLVEAAARRAPDAPAVIDGERSLTYSELDARANRLARALALGTEAPTARVGILLERGIDLVIAMLAAWKAGGAYVPLDPEQPAERLGFIVEDAGVTRIVTSASLLPRLGPTARRVLCVDRDAEAIARGSADPLVRDEDSARLAYVMYTSGSTGAPKGVRIPHRAIARLVCGTDYVSLEPGDVVAHVANPAFDAATFEVWGALVNGARIVVVPKLVALAPSAFAAFLEASGITTLFLTTALFNQMARDAPAAFARCRSVLFGGEAVDPRWVRAVLAAGPPRRLLHVYGPTEATTFATWHEIRAVPDDAVTIPIGRPIANTEAYVLEAGGEPAAIGIPGELCLGGPGLADGYLNRPELTAERFVHHPFSADAAARLYRTGDRVRRRGDGAIEYIGRLDRQVKIRGHRIEPGEVEAAIARHPQVREAFVDVRGDTPDTRQLVAYVVAAAAGPPPANLLGDLKRTLPAYMLPANIVWLKALPLTPAGKVDWRALPAPASARAARPPGTGPRDAFEEVLVAIWERVLGVSHLGIFDHFFEHGGHSLLAARLMDEIEHETGLGAPLSVLFTDDTIAGVAHALRAARPPRSAPIVALNAAGRRPPLVFLHGDLAGGGLYCRSLANALGPEQPLYVVEPHTLQEGAIPDTIEAMAADRIAVLRALRPRGPYCLGGYCNGALVAFEMARQLVAAGEIVPAVFAIETRGPQAATAPAPGERYVVLDRAGGYRELLPRDWDTEAQLRYLHAMQRYAGGRYDGRLVLVRSASLATESPRDLGWARCAMRVDVHDLPGHHTSIVTRHVADLARVIGATIDVIA